jgi:hypothetical protein
VDAAEKKALEINAQFEANVKKAIEKEKTK